MPWQGGVHNPEKHREEAVGASFRKRVVEVALEQWTQPHLQSDPKIRTDMPSRLQRQFHVTGTQYISTDKVQSQTLNTGGTAEDYFSPWANKPRAFFTIFRYQGQKVVRACTIRLLNLGSAKHEKGTKYLLPLTSFNLSHQTRHPALSRISAAPFCPTLYWPIHSSEIYLFGVHLQESCRS